MVTANEFKAVTRFFLLRVIIELHNLITVINLSLSIYKICLYSSFDLFKNNPLSDIKGGPLEPFWDVYTIHKSEAVRRMLEPYKIGVLDPKDVEAATAPTTKRPDDPFRDDPERSPVLVVRSQKPFNGKSIVSLSFG